MLLVQAVCLIAWIAEPRSAAPLSAALRTGAAFWLLGHGGRLGMPAGTVALIPLGLSLLFAALLTRAGAAVARVRPSGPRRGMLLVCAMAVAIPYALIAALVALGARGGGLQPSVWTAALGAFVIAAAAAAIGGARAVPVSPAGTPAKPSPLRAVAAGIGVAGALLLAVSAVVAAIALATHVSDAAALARPAKAGAVGGFGLLVLQAALTPNAVLWTASYVLGPGFALGAGTLVSPTGVHLGDVPGLPMLAALPASAAPWPVYVLFLVPPAAGVLAGVVMIRRLPRTPDLLRAGLLSLGVALAISLLAGLLAALSGGPVTRGRLGTIGPSFLQAGAAAALEVGVPTIVAALALTWHRQRHRGRMAAPPPTVGEWLQRVAHGVKAKSMAGGAATAGMAARVGRKLRHPLRSSRSKAGGDEDAEQDSPLVVDLTKHEVDLTDTEAVPDIDLTDAESGSASQSASGPDSASGSLEDDEPATEELEIVRVPVSLEKFHEAEGQEAPTEQPSRRRRPRLPSRPRRKPKVIKLPD